MQVLTLVGQLNEKMEGAPNFSRARKAWRLRVSNVCLLFSLHGCGALSNGKTHKLRPGQFCAFTAEVVAQRRYMGLLLQWWR